MSAVEVDGYVRKIETLGAIAARQNVVSKPLLDSIEELGELTLVESVTNCTPFGNYLIGWNYLEDEEAADDVEDPAASVCPLHGPTCESWPKPTDD